MKTSGDNSSSKGTIPVSTDISSKITKKKQTDLPKVKDRTTVKWKDYVNQLIEEEGEGDTDVEDQEYKAYLKRTREISKKKAAQKSYR